MWSIESFVVVQLSPDKSFFLGIMLDASVALSEPLHEPEWLFCDCCELKDNTPAGLLAVLAYLMAFLKLDLLWSTSRLGHCFQAKHPGEEHPDEPWEWPCSSQLLVNCMATCLCGTSVSHGEGAYLGPGRLLSPWLQPWAGISGLQQFQTIMSSPGIISLLEMMDTLINIGFSSSCHSSKFPDGGRRWVNFTPVKPEVMVLEPRDTRS